MREVRGFEAENRKAYIAEQAALRPSKRGRISPEDRPAAARVGDFSEVNLGFTTEEAHLEAERCLQCKHPTCMEGCPVSIDIPGFIRAICEGKPDAAHAIITKSHAFPCITGRVCPQETQCEARCVLERAGKPVNIGKLERYVGDLALASRGERPCGCAPETSFRASVGIAGSGPAGLACAAELLRAGVRPVLYEVFDRPGGVLTYGIPGFRLDEAVVQAEVYALLERGAKLVTGAVVGRSLSLADVLAEHDYAFLAGGAGLPRMMGIPGEDLDFVMTANEFLTRLNLLHAADAHYLTPLPKARRAIVIGGGNVAMDAARSARRLYPEVSLYYRRRREDLSARIEEIHHAEEEGVRFFTEHRPISIEEGAVVFATPGGERRIETDLVLVAIGTLPNKLMDFAAEGIAVENGKVLVDGALRTSNPRVFAGGDVVTGAATVILAMQAGKVAAQSIVRALATKGE